MSGNTIRTGRGMGMLAAIAGGATCACGQVVVPDFEPAVVFEVFGVGPYGVASADILKRQSINDPGPTVGQDGYPEIAIATSGVNYFSFPCDDPPYNTYIEIFRNTGNWEPDPTQGLVPHQTLDIPDGIAATELVFADVTGTLGPDLVLLGYDASLSLGYLLIYRNHGDGTFDDGVQVLPVAVTVSGVSFRGLVAEDLDLDGDIDIAAAVSDCIAPTDVVIIFNNETVLPNNPVLTPLNPVPLNNGNGTGPGDIVAGDFFPFGGGGQPLLDLVTPNSASPSISKIANLGNLNFAAVDEDRPGGCAFHWNLITATSGLFGADSIWDFAAVREDDLAVTVFKGLSSGQFQNNCGWDPNNGPAPHQVFPPDYETLFAHGIASGRLNADAYPDLVVAIRHYDIQLHPDPDWAGAAGVLLGLPDGSFQTPSPTQAYIFSLEDGYGEHGIAGSAMVEVVDLNGDGFDDIVVTNHESGWMSQVPDNFSVLINKLEETNPGG